MARRTKEEAAATRDSILDAAEKLFVEQGVSRTTLQHIATAAGVTRGAIYWHFDDKGALFNAMMERAILPLEAEMQVLDQVESDDPLVDLRNHMLAVLDRTVNDPGARRVFEIATLKVEFVGEMDAVRQRRKDNMANWMARAERRIGLAIDKGLISRDVNPTQVALGLWTMIDGLIRNWMFDPQDFDLLALGKCVIDPYLEGLRAGRT
ncbi:TetR family transcriptional regulator [Massilia sp. NEAU-DD11]|jgi:TetR/AcrR family acrAB operon transcriptional repressor|uniref:TetR family transcriptional regulator n=1 Tax=Massilia cellulosiltytica TaxID=2683234 RepID=A0A7X3KAK6_9BURK|nr:TetR family transcriptional regulator [Telluria cellulosilytica]MVW63136.1 TetR family transcriptional regulator [Telluria cellulosilytica]